MSIDELVDKLVDEAVDNYVESSVETVDNYKYEFLAKICRYELYFDVRSSNNSITITKVIREGEDIAISRFMSLMGFSRVQGRLRDYLSLKGRLDAKNLNLVLK